MLERTGEGLHGDRDHHSRQCPLRRVRRRHSRRNCHGRVAGGKDTNRRMIAKGQARTTCAISRPVFWVPASTPLKKISLSQGAEALESHGIEVSAIRRASPSCAKNRTLIRVRYFLQYS